MTICFILASNDKNKTFLRQLQLRFTKFENNSSWTVLDYADVKSPILNIYVHWVWAKTKDVYESSNF